jgi:hypothetical protein
MRLTAAQFARAQAVVNGSVSPPLTRQALIDYHVGEMQKHLAQINDKHGRWHSGRARFRARCAAHFALDVLGRDGE